MTTTTVYQQPQQMYTTRYRPSQLLTMAMAPTPLQSTTACGQVFTTMPVIDKPRSSCCKYKTLNRAYGSCGVELTTFVQKPCCQRPDPCNC